MTIRDRTVDETMPSIMGTAIRCMTSEPVPVLQRIGNGPRHDRDDRHHLRTHTPHRVQHNRLMKIRVALGHTAKFEILEWRQYLRSELLLSELHSDSRKMHSALCYRS